MRFFTRLLLATPFLLAAFVVAPAQTNEEPSVITWLSNRPGANKVVSKEGLIRVLSINDVHLAISMKKERFGSATGNYDRIIIYGAISNNSDRTVEISPDDFTVEALQPEYGLLKRETADQLARLLQQTPNAKGSLSLFGANQKTALPNQNANAGKPAAEANGSRTGVTAPGAMAWEWPAAEIGAMGQTAQKLRGNLTGLEFAAAKIAPGMTVTGILIFDQDIKPEEMMVRVMLEGKTCQFFFPRNQK